MRKSLVIAAVVVAAVTLTAVAGATPPEHGTFTFHDQFVDTDTCGFPIVGDVVFTNDNSAYFDAAGTITRVELHEITVGTFTANGVTLREHDQENVHVDFIDGVPVTAMHTGTFFHMVAPDGTLFLVAGQLVFGEVLDPQSGFYFDGPLIAAHGVDFGGDDATFCAAFS
jgi:hypothetical protein